MQTVFIEYIGKQAVRSDNIRHSGRVWNGQGDVLEMPLVERYSYLQYPTMFREVTKEEMELRKAAKVMADDGLNRIKEAAGRLTDEQIQSMAKSLQEEIELRAKNRLSAKVLKEDLELKEPTGLEVAESNDPATASAYHARIQKIVGALKEMDPKDRDQYTALGKPRVDFVSEMTGLKVTSGEIQEARSVMG